MEKRSTELDVICVSAGGMHYSCAGFKRCPSAKLKWAFNVCIAQEIQPQ